MHRKNWYLSLFLCLCSTNAVAENSSMGNYTTFCLEVIPKDVTTLMSRQRDERGATFARAQNVFSDVSPFPPEQERIDKHYIFYLLQAQEWKRGIDLYQRYKKIVGHHDFEVLAQMALTLLEGVAKSTDPEDQLASLFASSIAHVSTPLSIINTALFKGSPQTQLAAIHLLGQLQDDRSEALLMQAMASQFLLIRLEAAYCLSVRKAKTAVGQIESLMHRLPPQARSFFPQFFALIGTEEAIAILRQLVNDPDPTTRIEAILSVARFGRDDLLPLIRSSATDLSSIQQESCAMALGMLKDYRSLPILRKFASSPHINVRIAALMSLLHLGEEKANEELFASAKEGNLFAISLLQDIDGSEDLLASLLSSENIHVRFNATFSLLKRRDPRVAPYLKEFILLDTKDLGFQPLFSAGGALHAWKVIGSAQQQMEKGIRDLVSISLQVREEMLRTCIELPPAEFFEIANLLFDKKQNALIPLLIHLLEMRPSDSVLQLLKRNAEHAGAPLIRTYCQLALMRMEHRQEEERSVLRWVQHKKTTEMLHFRPIVSKNALVSRATQGNPLTPEEEAALLCEAYQTLAKNHTDLGIDILLEGIATGHPKNRAILAGLLIQAIE